MEHHDASEKPDKRRGYITAQCVNFIQRLQSKANQPPSNQNDDNPYAQSDQAKQEAAEARAEQERLKTQLAWRRITAEQHNAIVRSLRAHPATILVGHASSDPEATVYAEDIAKTFRDAGWVVNRSVFIGPQPT